MKKVIVPISSRSDEGLSAPIIKRLQKSEKLDVDTWNLEGQSGMIVSANACRLALEIEKPDFLLIVADRVEMTGAAMAAFELNVSIGHVYAGALGGYGTHDFQNRHVITLWSDIQFCESNEALERVENLKRSVGLTPNASVVGCTHMDDYKTDRSLVPSESYDLVLYNPLTRGDQHLTEMGDDLLEISSLINDSQHIIWIGPNPDKNAFLVSEYAKTMKILTLHDNAITFYDNVDRPKFLGLLSRCNRYIGNSSSMYYEAPFFLKEENIIPIGDRNCNREFVTRYEASDKIVNILEKLL